LIEGKSEETDPHHGQHNGHYFKTRNHQMCKVSHKHYCLVTSTTACYETPFHVVRLCKY